MTGSCVGHVQVISESNPNPLATIRKTLCANRAAHDRHLTARDVRACGCPSRIFLVGKGPDRGGGDGEGQGGPRSLSKFSSATTSV